MASGKMYNLTFDTTGSSCSIVLKKDDEIIDIFEKSMDLGQSEELMIQIKNILQNNSLTFADIGALFVCVGPGSFTGVRSSISAARVFSIACPDLKVGGVSAFDAYINTMTTDETADINAVIIETRRDDFYIQIFDKNLNKISEPCALDRVAIIEKLKNFGCAVSMVGDGVERFLSLPSGLCLKSIKIRDCLPVKVLAQTGLKQLKDKKINYPKPLYLRAPDVSIPKS